MTDSRVVQFGKSAIIPDAIANVQPLAIARGASVEFSKITNTRMEWRDFVARLANALRSPETASEFAKMSKDEQSKIKDRAGFWIGGEFKGKTRKRGDLIARSMLALDADFADPDFRTALDLALAGTAYVLHSTHKHTPEKPRYRIIVPLSRPVADADEFEAVGRKIAEKIGIDYFDDTTYQGSRPMFWPSHPSDVAFEFHVEAGGWCDPDAVLAQYADWRNVEAWPRSSRVPAIVKTRVAKVGDPGEKPGLIGAFCRAYSIPEAIDTFIPECYTQLDGAPDRYTYVGSTTSGGAAVYDDGTILYSHHSTDPAAGHACNAFDLVRIHKFGKLDAESPPSCPHNRLPSYLAMIELAHKDERTHLEVVARKLAEAEDEFGEALALTPPPTEPAQPSDAAPAGAAPVSVIEKAEKPKTPEWVKSLEATKKGQIIPNAENMLRILMNAPQFASKIMFNRFTANLAIRAPLPWCKARASLNGMEWGDPDDAQLRMWMTHFFKVPIPKHDLQDALAALEKRAAFDPLREMLEQLPAWDGVQRLDTMLVRHLGATDSAYTREIARRTLISAVMRAFEPGCKVDHVLVLQGEQGLGKSSFARLLAMKQELFGDDMPPLNRDKDAREFIRGKWIIELSELASFRGREAEAIKSFLTAQVDRFRDAYARRVKDNPRHCIFIATTNSDTPLHDYTGNRRFWPVKMRRSLDQEAFSAEVPQLWAEALEAYHAGEVNYLVGVEARSQAFEAQAASLDRDDESAIAGKIGEFLERPIPANWHDYADGAHDFDPDTKNQVVRDKTCALEIWIECLGGSTQNYNKQQADRIGRAMRLVPGWVRADAPIRFGTRYGRQRGYRKADF